MEAPTTMRQQPSIACSSSSAEIPDYCVEALSKATLPTIITESQRPFRILAVNEHWRGLCGFDDRDCIGNTPRMLQGAQTDKGSISDFARQVEAEDHGSVVVTNYTQEGRQFRHHLDTLPLKDQNGNTTHFMTCSYEVSSEIPPSVDDSSQPAPPGRGCPTDEPAEIPMSETFLTAFYTVDEPLILTSCTFPFTTLGCNEKCQELYGYTELELEGCPAWGWAHSEETDTRSLTVLHEALAAGQEVRVRLMQRMRLQGRCWNTISWTPVQDHAGKVIMLLSRLDYCEPLQQGQPAQPQFAEVLPAHSPCVGTALEKEEAEDMEEDWSDDEGESVAGEGSSSGNITMAHSNLSEPGFDGMEGVTQSMNEMRAVMA